MYQKVAPERGPKMGGGHPLCENLTCSYRNYNYPFELKFGTLVDFDRPNDFLKLKVDRLIIGDTMTL